MKLTEDFLTKELTLFCLFVLFVCFFRSCCISVKHPFKRTSVKTKTLALPLLYPGLLSLFPGKTKQNKNKKTVYLIPAPGKKMQFTLRVDTPPFFKLILKLILVIDFSLCPRGPIVPLERGMLPLCPEWQTLSN